MRKRPRKRKPPKLVPKMIAFIGTDYRGDEWLSPWKAFADIRVKRSGREIGFIPAKRHYKTAHEAVAAMRKWCEQAGFEIDASQLPGVVTTAASAAATKEW